MMVKLKSLHKIVCLFVFVYLGYVRVLLCVLHEFISTEGNVYIIIYFM